MDKFLTGCAVGCSSPFNFAVSDTVTVKRYHEFAKGGSLSDKYFSSSPGASVQNDMYFARAAYKFKDNSWFPLSKEARVCVPDFMLTTFYDPTIGHLLDACGVSMVFYAEGYNKAE